MDLLVSIARPPDHCSTIMPQMHSLVSQVRRNSSGIVDFWLILFGFSLYMTTPELEAIRGQSSAASLPTGPVMADPFISPLALTIWGKKVSFEILEIETEKAQHANNASSPNGLYGSKVYPASAHRPETEVEHSPHQRCPRSTGRYRQAGARACSGGRQRRA